MLFFFAAVFCVKVAYTLARHQVRGGWKSIEELFTDIARHDIFLVRRKKVV